MIFMDNNYYWLLRRPHDRNLNLNLNGSSREKPLGPELKNTNVPVNSKTAHAPRAIPGHLTHIKLRTVGNLTQNEARLVGHLTFV